MVMYDDGLIVVIVDYRRRENLITEELILLGSMGKRAKEISCVVWYGLPPLHLYFLFTNAMQSLIVWITYRFRHVRLECRP